MTLRIACVACLLVGCGKAKPADNQVADKAVVEKHVSADPACAAKVKDLEPWLAKLQLETKSHEIDFGPKLLVIDREPQPVAQHVDAVEIRKASIRAWDIGEHDHASSNLPEHATPKQLADFMMKTHDAKASADAFEPASDDLLRIDIDRDAAWADVTHVIDAATTAGYQHAVLAFTATSKLAPPAGVDDTTKTDAAAKAASDQLEALGSRCKPLGSVGLRHHRSQVAAEDAAALAKESAAAVLECSCAVDPDELRKLAWIDARWHQAVPRVGVTLDLTGATTTLALPAKTPWSEAYAQVLAATGPIKLAAK
jgi:hypothetical protein